MEDILKKIKQTDVAIDAGVSPATVSRVINNNGYVADDVRKHVNLSITKLKYKPTSTFITKSIENSKLIGLILRKTEVNLYFEKLSTSLNIEAEKYDYHILTMHKNNLNNTTIKDYVSELISAKVRAIIICGFSEDFLNSAVTSLLRLSNIPIIFIERGVGSSGFNRIKINNSLGIFKAASYLLEKGHTHLLYITRQLSTKVEVSRKQGFVDAISNYPNDTIYPIIVPCPNPRIQSGYNAMRYALDEDPAITGVLTWCDGYAAGAMQYLYKKKISIPNQIEIIGYDDTMGDFLSPKLSSVRMPFEAIAQKTIGIINKHKESPYRVSSEDILLNPELVLRETTKS